MTGKWVRIIPDVVPFEQRLRELEAKATPGPVIITENCDYWLTGKDEALIAKCGDIGWPEWDERQREWEANARLLCALRNAAPALIALVEAARRSLSAHEREAKAKSAAEVATDNFTDPNPELDKLKRAMIAASDAELDLRQALAAEDKEAE